MGNPYTGYYGTDPFYNQNNGVGITKKAITEYICSLVAPSEVVHVDEFETPRMRHICRGTQGIKLLDKTTVEVPTKNGIIYVDVFICPYCRKLVIDSSSMQMGY